MLVKRDYRLSGLFDPYSDGDESRSPWPDDDPLADGTENSAVRPAPRFMDASPEPASSPDAEANPSGVATPRFWDVRVPTGSAPLPVVTATSEPTQRGLGIPPPPTEEEAAAFADMPPLKSVAPLSLDAFDENAVSRSSFEKIDAPSPRIETTENERITVPAPAKTASRSRPGRPHVYALAAGLAAGLLLAIVRGRPAPDDRVVATAPTALPRVRKAAPVPVVVNALTEGAVRAQGKPAPAEIAPSDTTPETEGIVRTDAARFDSRRSRPAAAHRSLHADTRTERAPARQPSTARDPVARVASGLEAPATGANDDATAAGHRMFSLPPR